MGSKITKVSLKIKGFIDKRYTTSPIGVSLDFSLRELAQCISSEKIKK